VIKTMLKIERYDEDGNPVINVRDRVQTKSKNAYTKKLGRSYWLRRHHEIQFLKAVFNHAYEDNGLSIAGILNYVKSGEFEDDIMAELIKREGIENEKRKIIEEKKIADDLIKNDTFESAKISLKELVST
jgi:protein-arginine kinase activator protein McsA